MFFALPFSVWLLASTVKVKRGVGKYRGGTAAEAEPDGRSAGRQTKSDRVEAPNEAAQLMTNRELDVKANRTQGEKNRRKEEK
jgi:hypothetical protein